MPKPALPDSHAPARPHQLAPALVEAIHQRPSRQHAAQCLRCLASAHSADQARWSQDPDKPATWREFGGTRYAPTADGATREQQIEIAAKVRDTRGGYGSWPACARKLDLPR
ncbi:MULTISPECIES: transglycosylase family protein [Pseudonocardia]|uniref:transglycosylase family protein n=1 Tax=Pseudonocardia TaxID=1847 RepID=UPI0027D9A55D|nr:transglycosylase family protein [Pseudonocardia saturnea]